MTNIEALASNIGNTISKSKDVEVWFSNIDLNYAYSQLKLDPETSKHCFFNLIGGDCTGTYSLKLNSMV